LSPSAEAIGLKALLLIGVVLVILGLIGLEYEGVTVTHEKKVVERETSHPWAGQDGTEGEGQNRGSLLARLLLLKTF
jgi:hypothetical protein